MYFISFREFFNRFFTPKNKLHVSRNRKTEDLESSEFLSIDNKLVKSFPTLLGYMKIVKTMSLVKAQ